MPVVSDEGFCRSRLVGALHAPAGLFVLAGQLVAGVPSLSLPLEATLACHPGQQSGGGGLGHGQQSFGLGAGDGGVGGKIVQYPLVVQRGWLGWPVGVVAGLWLPEFQTLPRRRGAAGVLVGEDNLEGVFRHMDFGLPCGLFVGEIDAGKPRAEGLHQLEAVKDCGKILVPLQ